MIYEHGAVEGQLLGAVSSLQVGPAPALGDRCLGVRLLGHLQEQQVGQFRDVLVVRDAVVAEDVAQVPELGDDVVGGVHAFTSSTAACTSSDIASQRSQILSMRADAYPSRSSQ